MALQRKYVAAHIKQWEAKWGACRWLLLVTLALTFMNFEAYRQTVRLTDRQTDRQAGSCTSQLQRKRFGGGTKATAAGQLCANPNCSVATRVFPD